MRGLWAVGGFVVAVAGAPAWGAEDDAWAATLERVTPAIVSVQVDRVRAFDSTFVANSQATAFVVDAERGILLTNRHVVNPGPVVAVGLFQGDEELPLTPLYRDPVHDFGFFAYDPSALRFVDPPSLPLFPEGARVGVEIRVVGNDAGEKLSILQGTLARLDRPAPFYGTGSFNDFNTFYLQAASSTSGGSSGSPVVDVRGRVVGLNAGGSRGAASSFYLPLDRVQRALALVQAGQPVPRGSLLTTFVHKPWDALAKLGLPADTEAAARAALPGSTGLLVVDDVLPGGVAAGLLQPGDIVRTLDGRPLGAFVPLEAVLDERVGQGVRLGVVRGGEAVEVSLTVADLHAVTPASFVELGDGVVHDVSYQIARSYHLPLEGVWVADVGYVLERGGVPFRSIVRAVDDRPTPDTDAFLAVLASLPDGAKVPVRYIMPDAPERERVTVVTLDRQWFPFRRCAWDGAGAWPCETLPGAPVARPGPVSTTLADDVKGKAAQVVPGLVRVDVDLPYELDGVSGDSFVGIGLIVDADEGLVAVDRNTLPLTLADVEITVAGTVRVPAEALALHPVHGLALLRYDPALLGDTPLVAPRRATATLGIGDKVTYVGRRFDGTSVVKPTTVDDVDDVGARWASRPAFREGNLTVPRLGADLPAGGGVLMDKRGRVVALHGSYQVSEGRGGVADRSASYPIALVDELVAAWRSGAGVPALEAQLVRLSLADVVDRGLPEVWTDRLAAHDAQRRALVVIARASGSPAADALEDGDVVLAANGTVVTAFAEVEAALAEGALTLTVYRRGEVRDVAFTPRRLPVDGLARAVLWGGLAVQQRPHAAALQKAVPDVGVYVDLRWRGGPGVRAGVPVSGRIVAVDGAPTPDLDAFLAAVDPLEDGASVRLTVVDLEGRTRVVPLRVDESAYPTQELVRGSEGWRRVVR